MGKALVLALAACGGTAPPPQPIGPPAAAIAAPAPGDVIVAMVNGRPVFGSCVAAQARQGDRNRALAECVDFELMAQAAERRGLAADPDVVAATRAALVSRLVEVVYEDGFQQPSEFGAAWDKLRDKTLIHVRHGEYRASTYVRAEVPPKASPDLEAAARALAQDVAAAAAHETGLLGPDLVAIADRVAAGRVFAHHDVAPYLAVSLDDDYAHALFAIPEVGRASSAVRTKYGWDVIAWTAVVPAADPPDSEIAERLLPEVKRTFFATWVDRIAKASHIHYERIDANVPLLEDLP